MFSSVKLSVFSLFVMDGHASVNKLFLPALVYWDKDRNPFDIMKP